MSLCKNPMMKKSVWLEISKEFEESCNNKNYRENVTSRGQIITFQWHDFQKSKALCSVPIDFIVNHDYSSLLKARLLLNFIPHMASHYLT